MWNIRAKQTNSIYLVTGTLNVVKPELKHVTG